MCLGIEVSRWPHKCQRRQIQNEEIGGARLSVAFSYLEDPGGESILVWKACVIRLNCCHLFKKCCPVRVGRWLLLRLLPSMRIWFWHQCQHNILGVVAQYCKPRAGEAEIGRSLGFTGQTVLSNEWALRQWKTLSQDQGEQLVKSNTWSWPRGDVCAHSHIWCPPTLTKGCPLFVLLTLHCASGSVSSEDLEPVGLGRSWALLSNRMNLVLSVRNYQLCEHTISLKNMICKSDLCEVL